jgi:hypothetical protein
VKGLIDKMISIVNEQTLNGTLHALKSIATVHLRDTMEAILGQDIPHQSHVTKVMQLFARDSGLALSVIKYLTDLINNGNTLEDKEVAVKDSKEKEALDSIQKEKIPTRESQSVTICLSEILAEEEVEELVQTNFALIFTTLALRVGTTCGYPVPAEQVTVSWKNFFTVLQEVETLEKLTELGTFGKLADRILYTEGITTVTGLVCKRHANEMRNIFKTMYPYLKANYNGHRYVVAFSFGEMVNYVNTDTELLDQLITQLLSCLSDPLLKIAALRGISNIVSCPIDLTNKYAPTILDALMSSIDDSNDDIALESMNGLAKLFRVVEESRITPVLINICHRIRPSFDNPNELIRASAAALFGGLARFGNGSAKDKFIEQIHNNLTSILLHINDENEAVQTAFKKALFDVSPLLKNEALTSILNTSHIFSIESDIEYPDFIHMHMSKVLITSWPNRINAYVQQCIDPYFASKWDIIKANACYFIGAIMGHLPEDMRKDVGINTGGAAKAITELMGDKSTVVRQKAAEAIGMLWNY